MAGPYLKALGVVWRALCFRNFFILAIIYYAFKYAKKSVDLMLLKKRQRQERLKVAAAKGNTGGAIPKIEHTALFSLPAITESGMAELGASVKKMMEGHPEVQASWSAGGSTKLDQKACHSALGRPDKTAGSTHCLFLVSNGVPPLKALLNSAAYKSFEAQAQGFTKDGTGNPFVMDVDLTLDLKPEGKEDPILMLWHLRLKPTATEDSEVYKTMQQLITDFGTIPGNAASMQSFGYGPLAKEDLLKDLGCKDNSEDMTHIVTITADSPDCLKALLKSKTYAQWTKVMPNQLLYSGQRTPNTIFFAPLTVTAQK